MLQGMGGTVSQFGAAKIGVQRVITLTISAAIGNLEPLAKPK